MAIRHVIDTVAGWFRRADDLSRRADAAGPAPAPRAAGEEYPPRLADVAPAIQPINGIAPPLIGNGDLDNSAFVAELRREAEARRQAGVQVALSPFSLPRIRLPKPNKVAFNALQLFAQQQDMTTFDYGLQAVLDALYDGVAQCFGTAVPLDQFRFTMNFSGACDATSKVFSVRMTYPVVTDIQLSQFLDDGNPRWRFTAGDYYTELERRPQEVAAQIIRNEYQPLVPNPRNERVIDFGTDD